MLVLDADYAATDDEVVKGAVMATNAQMVREELDNARAHTKKRCERLEEGFVRERDRAAVAELVLADQGAQLREEAHRELISIEVSNDCWAQCAFLRVSMNSLLWLWLLREIVAENAKEECETVFCATSIKVPMVPYLNESCMSLSGMSSGPHGQTSAPAHEFSSSNMSNEVCYKSCSLHKSTNSALQRDDYVYFDSHLGSPADSALCNVTCPGNSSQFSGGRVASEGEDLPRVGGPMPPRKVGGPCCRGRRKTVYGDPHILVQVGEGKGPRTTTSVAKARRAFFPVQQPGRLPPVSLV